jgi:acetolactate synthase-1/2/3 large subunit
MFEPRSPLADRPFPSPGAAAPEASLSEALTTLLEEVGVDSAFGILGGSVAPIYDAIARSSIRLVHCRHESGAAFAATESYFASGRPAVAFATAGPGVVNALTGLTAARWDGAKVLFIAGTTSAVHRGRFAFQETSAYSMPAFFTSGSLFDYAVSLEDPGELDEVAARLAAGLARPGGFVAGIGVPVALQRSPVPPRAPRLHRAAAWGCDPVVAADCARRLADGPLVIWVGFGARHAAAAVRALAERTSALVMCTPRGKGIFPEDHPQFLGVTGSGGHPEVGDHLGANPPARVLVLGSRLGEFSSFWDPRLVPQVEFLHVDVDPTVPFAAYPAAPTYAVHAEIGAFLGAVLRELGAGAPAGSGPALRRPLPTPAAPGGNRVSTARLFEAIQRRVVDGSDALVLTEAGNAIVWSVNALRFGEPGRFRASNRFGSMGHAAAGVIGSALGRRGKAVAIVGDGSMLMFSEVNTAVAYGIPAVWIVLNNARYAMTHEGMKAVGFEPRGTEFPEVDFAAVARGMGAAAVRVERDADLDAALDAAMRADGPFLVDVLVDQGEPAPATRRNQSLKEQWRPRT